MSCNNKMLETICAIYEDSWGYCEARHMCTMEMFGGEFMLEKAVQIGLDKNYPDEFSELKRRVENGRS